MASTLLLISGSLRAGSTNGALLRTVPIVAPDVMSSTYDGMALLPHFNPDDDVEPLHPEVAALRAAIAAAGAVLLCTPEYAGALPGSFKNLLDWTVGGGEVYDKPVAWVNAGWGPTAAAGAHASLRAVLGYVGARIVEDACRALPVTRPMIGPDGSVTDAGVRDELAAAVQMLMAAATE